VNNRREGWGLWFWGDNSLGKTYGATVLLKAVVSQGYSGYCILADELRAAYIKPKRFDPDMNVMERVETVEFLLIEDLGKEYSGKGSDWAEMCLENLFRRRSRKLLPMMVTTNMSPKAFAERYKQSALAISMETMTPIEVKGPDWRRELARNKMKEYQTF
jgi:DNA replication protein DnaC